MKRWHLGPEKYSVRIKLIDLDRATGIIEETPGYFMGRCEGSRTALLLQEIAYHFVFIEINHHFKVGRQTVHATGPNLTLHMFDKLLKMQVVAVESFQVWYFSRNKHECPSYATCLKEES
jgi:hypothetical protein